MSARTTRAPHGALPHTARFQAQHLLKEYAVLSAVEVDVTEDLWTRVETSEGLHEHGFVRRAPEKSLARVRMLREQPPEVVSGFTGLTVLKTTQSGT